MLKEKLKSWNKEVFGNIFQEKHLLEIKMQEIQQAIIMEGHTIELEIQERKIQLQLNERLNQEEILWKEKSKIQWLKEGEKNTKLFHHSLIQHRKNNKIYHLIDEQGNMLKHHK